MYIVACLSSLIHHHFICRERIALMHICGNTCISDQRCMYYRRYFNPLSSILSTFIYFHPLSSTSNHCYQCLSTFIHLQCNRWKEIGFELVVGTEQLSAESKLGGWRRSFWKKITSPGISTWFTSWIWIYIKMPLRYLCRQAKEMRAGEWAEFARKHNQGIPITFWTVKIFFWCEWMRIGMMMQWWAVSGAIRVS